MQWAAFLWVLVVVVVAAPVELVVLEVVVEVPEVAGAPPVVWAYATTANTLRTRVSINVLRIERSFVRKRSEVILRPEAQSHALAMPSQRHERGPVFPGEEPRQGAGEGRRADTCGVPLRRDGQNGTPLPSTPWTPAAAIAAGCAGRAAGRGRLPGGL